MKNDACELRDEFLRLASRFQTMKADNREDWVRYLRNASAWGMKLLQQSIVLGLVRRWYIPETYDVKNSMDVLMNEVYHAEAWYMTFGLVAGGPRKTAKRYATICRKLAKTVAGKNL